LPDRATDLATGDDDDEIEAEEVKRMEEVEEPTARQRQEHEEENHAIYRKWCNVCVAGRGVGGQHRRDRRELAEKVQDGPMICSDFFYMSTDELGSTPMLVVKSTRTGRISATALESKGVTSHGVRFFAEVIARQA
jgi:hypothetical protein